MKLKHSLHGILIAFALTTCLPSHPARAADQEKSKFDVNFRYRYEFVDQDGFTKDAHASTLRTRLAYRSRYFSNFGFLIDSFVPNIGNMKKYIESKFNVRR